MIKLMLLAMLLTACSHPHHTPTVKTVVVSIDVHQPDPLPDYFTDTYQIGGPYYRQDCSACQIGIMPVPAGIVGVSLTCNCKGPEATYRSSANLFNCTIQADPNYIIISNQEGLLTCTGNVLPPPQAAAISNVVVAGAYSDKCTSTLVTYGRYGEGHPYLPLNLTTVCDDNDNRSFISLVGCAVHDGFFNLDYDDGQLSCEG